MFFLYKRIKRFYNRRFILVLLLLAIIPVRYLYGTTNQELLRHYKKQQYLVLLNILKFDYHQNYDRIQLYLLFKTLLKTNEFDRAEIVLRQLDKKIGPGFKDVVLIEKVSLLIQKGEKEKLLIFITQSPEKFTNSYVEEYIKQIFINNYTTYKDKQLIRKCLETLFPVLISFLEESDILTIYYNALDPDHPSRGIILADIWEHSDITESLAVTKEFTIYVKKAVIKYQNAILNHFNNQLTFKNYSYIIKEIPDFLTLLKDQDKDNFSRLRRIYFKAMTREKRLTRLINKLQTEKGRRFFKMSHIESVTRQIELLLKNNNIKQAIQLTQRLKKLDPKTDLQHQYFAIANKYYQNRSYKKSLEYFNKTDFTMIPKRVLSKAQWALFRIHHILNNRKELRDIINWSNTFDFENDEIAARFCYWGYKLRLFQEGNRKECYNKFPLTYYGLHSENPASSVSIRNIPPDNFALPGFNGNEVPNGEKRFLAFLETLYKVGEEKIADSIVTEKCATGIDIASFIEIANILFNSKRYFLLQTIVHSYYQELSLQSNKERKYFLPYIYPNAYYPEVKQLSEKTKVPELLVFSVMREESGFRPDVKSVSGAIGLMQLMPKTAKYIGKIIGIKVDVNDLTEPDLNLKLGTAYLKRLLKRYKGNVYYTLAAYNGGPGNVKRWRKKMASEDIDQFVEAITFVETQNYVRRVMRSFYIYQKVYGQKL